MNHEFLPIFVTNEPCFWAIKLYTIKIKDFNPTITVLATGHVMGYCWGGGKASYPAKQLKGNTIEEVLELAKKGLNGSLDSGMGFEKLVGAKLTLHVITRITIEDREFENIEYQEHFIGELSDADIDHLIDC